MPKRRQKHSTQPKLRELKSLNKICKILIKTLFMLLNILKELNRFVPQTNDLYEEAIFDVHVLTDFMAT